MSPLTKAHQILVGSTWSFMHNSRGVLPVRVSHKFATTEGMHFCLKHIRTGESIGNYPRERLLENIAKYHYEAEK